MDPANVTEDHYLGGHRAESLQRCKLLIHVKESKYRIDRMSMYVCVRVDNDIGMDIMVVSGLDFCVSTV